MELRKLYTIEEVAEYLGLTVETCWRLMNEEKLRYRSLGKTRKFTASDIDEFIESRARKGTNKKFKGGNFGRKINE